MNPSNEYRGYVLFYGVGAGILIMNYLFILPGKTLSAWNALLSRYRKYNTTPLNQWVQNKQVVLLPEQKIIQAFENDFRKLNKKYNLSMEASTIGNDQGRKLKIFYTGARSGI